MSYGKINFRYAIAIATKRIWAASYKVDLVIHELKTHTLVQVVEELLRGVKGLVGGFSYYIKMYLFEKYM